MKGEAHRLALPIALGCAVTGALFLLEGHLGLNLADEGFLWYGAQRVLAGALPLRDFQAYDPGRYFWEAAFLAVFGHGVIALRLGLLAAHASALALALVILRRARARRSELVLWAVVFALWLVPRHKAFEALFAASATWILSRSFVTDSPRRGLGLGLFFGLTVLFGRNLALYFSVAMVFAAALAWRSGWRPTRVFSRDLGVGLGVGAAPLLLMYVGAEGFAGAFVESIGRNVRNVNLPLPVPWPWRTGAPATDALARAQSFLLGCAFLILPGLVAIALWLIVRRPRTGAPTFAAAVFVSAASCHHAFARADLSHLAQVALTPLLALALWTCRTGRPAAWWAIPVAAIALSAVTTWPLHPFWTIAAPETTIVAGDELGLDGDTAAFLRRLDQIVKTHGAIPTPFVAPYWPGVYAVYEWRAPTWEIYFFFPADKAAEQRLIAQLGTAPPAFALIGQDKLDGRDELAFARTHPQLLAHLEQLLSVDDSAPPGTILLTRKP